MLKYIQEGVYTQSSKYIIKIHDKITKEVYL